MHMVRTLYVGDRYIIRAWYAHDTYNIQTLCAYDMHMKVQEAHMIPAQYANGKQ